LDRDGERGFDYLTIALVSSKASPKCVGLRVADSHTGNHPKDDFTPLKTIRRSYSVIREKIPFELEQETFEPERGKLASGLLSSHAMRAKTFASQDDASFLSISDNDEGLLDFFKLKDANACHLKISAITLPAWKGHLDNQMDLELLDLHDRCYTQQAVVDNAVNRRALAMAEFDQNPAILALQEKISSLTADVTEHKEADKARLEAVEVSLHREVEELKQDRRDVVSKVVHYATIELVHSDELGRLVGKLVSSAVTYKHCRAYEQVADMKEPFELSKPEGYRSSC
nr:hypothetical protein [Tanacetum cinerariifolium]